ALARDVRDDAAAVVQRPVPLGESGLDLGDVGSAVGEANRLPRLGEHAVLVPGDLPGEREHELRVHAGERDDRDEGRTERLGDSLDRPTEETRVEEIRRLDERGLRIREPAQHGLRYDGLRLDAVRPAEDLRPTRALTARAGRRERGRHRAALAYPAVVECEVRAERAHVHE